MDWQTGLNILLAVVAGILGVKNYQMQQIRESQRESNEMTEIRVQLMNVMSMLQDMQKDIRTSTADFRALSERVVIIETKVEAAFQRIDELRRLTDGKQ